MIKNKKIPVYFMPGMAANPSIFENIKLPEDRFEVHLLEWLIPLPKETIQAYALRLSASIIHSNPVLIGVSFGGVLVQEISKLIAVKKLIIISSIKSNLEMPSKMKFAKITRIYKLLPTSLADKIKFLNHLNLGKAIGKRLALYQKYMSVSDKTYLDWAIDQILNWTQVEVIKDIIHIHGIDDDVFPIANIKNAIQIKGGTHVMIINKYKWFNENLPILIDK